MIFRPLVGKDEEISLQICWDIFKEVIKNQVKEVIEKYT